MRLPMRSLVALAVLASAAGAHAQGLKPGTNYIGGNVGHSHWGDPINGVTGEAKDLDGKLYYGRQFTPNFAVEAGTMALGRISNATGDAKAYGLFADAVGTVPLAQNLSAFGRAGVAQARFKTYAGGDSSPGVKLGAGLQYDLTPALAVRGEWERYHFRNTFNNSPNVDQYSLGLRYAY